MRCRTGRQQQHRQQQEHRIQPLHVPRFHRVRNRRSSHPTARVGREGQNRRRNCPSQNHPVVDHRQPSKNKFTQPSRPDRRGNRRQARPKSPQPPAPPKESRSRPAAVALATASCDSVSPMPRPASTTAGIDSADSRVRISNNGQQGIKRERQNRQPVGSLAQPRYRQQEPEKRQTRNGLHNVGAPQNQVCSTLADARS